MAVIFEDAWGLKPLTQPKLFKTYPSSGTVLRFQPVNLASNLVFAATDATAGIYGVAMNHATGGEDVIVCIDPDMHYLCTSDAEVVQANVGLYVELDNNTSTGPTSEVCGCNIRHASLNTTDSDARGLQVVGLDTAVAQNSTTVTPDYKCIVKIADIKWPQT